MQWTQLQQRHHTRCTAGPNRQRHAAVSSSHLRYRPASTKRWAIPSAKTDEVPAAAGAAAADPYPWSQPGYKGAVVSQLPPSSQAAVIAAIAVGIGAGTAVTANVLGPAVSQHLPTFLQVTGHSWFPLGPIFMAAGVAHFTEERGFKNMYPHTGAWGLWYLPGSKRFHVWWTGVAEILGGLGLILGSLPLAAIPTWLAPASAYGLFALTIAVTPANMYMYTHNAPGPIPDNMVTDVIPWQGHLARGAMQVLLLSTLWGIATAAS